MLGSPWVWCVGFPTFLRCPRRDQKAAEQLTRTLRGVMRVGLVAKGLLLKGDLDLELVLLCKDKPTSELLQKVADNLGVQLAVSAAGLRRSVPPVLPARRR